MRLEIGQIYGEKYRILRRIGEGAMGAVYEGENIRIHRRVAIKTLHGGVASKADTVTRFEREAQAAGRIGSEHIVEVLDMGELEDGTRFMVMEFLEGMTLSQRIRSKGRLTPEETSVVLMELLEGLAGAHQAGIIHRDLKPANVFLLHSKNGRSDFVKILDFGVSKFSLLGGEEMSMTSTGAVLGTPFYMSPEQAKGSAAIDLRSDIYTVGVIAYECVTGQVPYAAETFNELLFKIVLESPPPAETFVPDLDPAFAAILRKTMARDPADRYQTAAELSRAFEEWLAARPKPGALGVGHTVMMEAAAPPPARPQAPPGPPGRMPAPRPAAGMPVAPIPMNGTVAIPAGPAEGPRPTVPFPAAGAPSPHAAAGAPPPPRPAAGAPPAVVVAPMPGAAPAGYGAPWAQRPGAAGPTTQPLPAGMGGPFGAPGAPQPAGMSPGAMPMPPFGAQPVPQVAAPPMQPTPQPPGAAGPSWGVASPPSASVDLHETGEIPGIRKGNRTIGVVVLLAAVLLGGGTAVALRARGGAPAAAKPAASATAATSASTAALLAPSASAGVEPPAALASAEVPAASASASAPAPSASAPSAVASTPPAPAAGAKIGARMGGPAAASTGGEPSIGGRSRPSKGRTISGDL
jgi:serine/threonine-protein kinase